MDVVDTVPRGAAAAARPATPAELRQTESPVEGRDRRRLLAICGALCALALLATLTSAPSEYVRDNRFEFFWAPDHLLSRYSSIWDDSLGLGFPRWDFWPTAVVPYLLHTVGLPAWVIERIWHSFELALGGIGTVLLLRQFRRRIGIEHVIAGLAYMFNPITLVFLVPSSLFLGYAFAPWLVLTFVLGVRGSRPVRWAAVFALFVLAAGNVNYPGYPGLALAALPIVPTALYLVFVERSTRWRSIVRWLLVAVGLSLLVSAAALVPSYLGRDALSENLGKTETLEAISTNSSWAESWRGVGFWLAYWGSVMPQLARYVTTAPVVLATFLAPLVALATLWRTRWRARLLFASFMVLGVAVMVGAFPNDDPSPYGRALDDLFANIAPLAGLRAGFKASGALAMGVSALVGVAVASVSRSLASRGWLRWAPAAGAVAAIAVVAFPFATGRLYGDVRMRDVPDYWRAAISWLDEQPGEGRVLVLPSTVNASYTWGSPGDDLLEGMLDRTHVMRSQLSQSQGTARSADLVSALGDYLEAARYEPGVLAPIARRLGIRYVLIRNDLEWQSINRPNPVSFDGLRDDPDLRRVRAFGARGQNLSFDLNPEGNALLRRLHPVEIYEVRDWVPAARANDAPALVVAGDGAAWPALSAAGLLDGTGPVRYTADLDARTLRHLVARGSRLVVTDTNRRRTESIPLEQWPGGFGATLVAGEEGERPPTNLFSGRATETVAEYADGTRISASTYGSGFPPPQTPFRPSRAFDDDLDTAWLGATLSPDPTGIWIRVNFAGPVEISSLTVVAAPSQGSRRASGATIHFSDGSSLPGDLTRRRAEVTFPSRTTTSLEARVSRVNGSGFGAVGFSEIAVPGLDLAERIRLPEDWLRMARDDVNLAAALERAPVDYLFGALPPVVLFETEPQLDRRFEVIGERDFALTGVVRLRGDTPPDLLAALSAELPGDGVCHTGIVGLDGIAVAVRLLDDPRALQFGVPSRFEACRPVALGDGSHSLRDGPGLVLDRVRLSTGDVDLPTSPPATRLRSSSNHEAVVDIDSTGRTALILGQSYDSAWQASVQGTDLGAPVPLDTMTGWIVEADGPIRLHASYGPQRWYVIAWVVTAVGVVLCLAAIAWPRRRRV